MKTKRLVLATLLVAASLLCFVGCGKGSGASGTPAGQLVAAFDDKAKNASDIEALANDLHETVVEVVPIETEVMPLSDGDWIEGFTTEITGFESCVAIKPFMMGQPFIAYIFEVSNPDEFAKTLEDSADLRWNICTMADECKTSVSGNYVFFTMSKENFDE